MKYSVITMVLVGAVCGTAHADDEPVFEGRTLSEWVSLSYETDGSKTEYAYMALRHFPGEAKALKAIRDAWKHQKIYVERQRERNPESASTRTGQYVCAISMLQLDDAPKVARDITAVMCDMIDKEGVKQVSQWNPSNRDDDFPTLVRALGAEAEPMIPHLKKIKKRLKDDSTETVEKIIDMIEKAVDEKKARAKNKPAAAC